MCRHLHDWTDIAKCLDIATGFFEIGGLLELEGSGNSWTRSGSSWAPM